MKTLITAVIIIITSYNTVVQAATVNQREAAQRSSIRAGLEDGSLTGKEAKRLRNQQAKLEVRERAFKADGEFTPRERIQLQSRLDANRARIYQQRHDEQVQEQ